MTEDELRALIAAHPVEGTPERMRDAFEALAEAAGAPDLAGLDLAEGGDEDAPFVLLRPEGSHGAPIVHLHGGGYVFGSARSHLAFAAALAREAGRPVVLPGYPLAPEAPWPAMRDAALAFLAALGEPYVLSGDSAGGHLAVAATLAGARPEALLLFSPNVTRAYGRLRSRAGPRDAMNDHETDDLLARMAFGGTAPSDPGSDLLRTDLSALPPVYLDVGLDEVLLDEVVQLASALARAGVRLTLRTRPGFHMEQLFAASYPPARQGLALAAQWLSGTGHGGLSGQAD